MVSWPLSRIPLYGKRETKDVRSFYNGVQTGSLITKEDFMIKVTRFTAEWCSPCRALAPVIEDIKSQNSDVEFQTIDIDEDPETVSKYGIRAVPVVLIENNGIETNRFIGVQPRLVYEEAINNQRSN
jgi:thioredoxin 1